MQLIGMLDSPYVRRTAISLRLLGITFEHKPLSVFSTFEQFQKINPIVKAPSFVCDDGEVLMDSTLIIDYAEAIASAGKSLMPREIKARQHELRVLGIALAACEKAVQIVYERNLRPVEKQHEPWLSRIRGQVNSAFTMLEGEVAKQPPSIGSGRTTQSGVTIAVTWQFAQSMVADFVNAADYPAIGKFSTSAEKLDAFTAFPPDGPGVPTT
jgi:glutathione S-transferase